MEPILAHSRQRRPPSRKASNGYSPFHHGQQLSWSATGNHCFSPSATVTQLTHLSSNCRLQRQYSLCRDKSWSCGLPVTVAWLATNWLTAKVCRVLQTINPTTHSNQLLGDRASAVPITKLPSNSSDRRVCTRLTLLSRPKLHFPRLSPPIWFASTVVITLLFDAGST